MYTKFKIATRNKSVEVQLDGDADYVEKIKLLLSSQIESFGEDADIA